MRSGALPDATPPSGIQTCGTRFATLLPDGTAVAQIDGLGECDAHLFPEERLSLGRAVPSRIHEFAAGRCCSRAALARLGISSGPVLVGSHREPLFPPGVVGSITHTRDFCAAAVALKGRTVSLGIDAEANQTLPEGVGELVMEAAELQEFSGVVLAPEIAVDALLFSAKESVFKAVFPFARTYFGFEDCVVLPPRAPGTLRVHRESRVWKFLPAGATLHLRFACCPKRVYTAAVVLVEGAAASD